MSWKKERMSIDLFAIGSANADTTGTQMSYKDEKKKQGKKKSAKFSDDAKKKPVQDKKPVVPKKPLPGNSDKIKPIKKDQDVVKRKP